MLTDRYDRPLRDLRVSVTDRCNFRCTYCMPLAHYDWIAKNQILTYEEIVRVAEVFARLGVRKLRITGGEPLLRKGLERLVSMLSSIPAIEDLCLTTNGFFLGDRAVALRRAGLRRVTVSLDSLRSETFARMAQRGSLETVLDGIAAAASAGLAPVKINTVIERGVNDDEILELLGYALEAGHEIRFIEYMDVGNVNSWTSSKLYSRSEILGRISARYAFEPLPGRGSAPSERFRMLDQPGTFGVIGSVTEPFCGSCTRARLTADGRLVTCLFSTHGHDLKSLLRSGVSDLDLERWIAGHWEVRSDRYSERRLEAIASVEGYNPDSIQKIEMISLGG